MWAELWAALPYDVRAELQVKPEASVSERLASILRKTARKLRPRPHPLVIASTSGAHRSGKLTLAFVDWITLHTR